MDRANDTGFQKYADAAQSFYQLLDTAQKLPDDVIVYLITHLDEDQNGNEIMKVVGGKFIQEKIDPVGYATIALKADKTKDGYQFRTQTSGHDFYKSPIDMFEDEFIENDLKTVDDSIRDYYDIES